MIGQLCYVIAYLSCFFHRKLLSGGRKGGWCGIGGQVCFNYVKDVFVVYCVKDR